MKQPTKLPETWPFAIRETKIVIVNKVKKKSRKKYVKRSLADIESAPF